MDYKIFWTDESIRNLESIISYLETEWTEKELNKFKSKLSTQIELISKNPQIFPVSQYQNRLRKAVLSKHTTIYYEIKNNQIFIAYLFSNRMDIKNIK